MLHITFKLRRFKALTHFLSIFYYPLIFPFFIFYMIGKGAEYIIGFINDIFYTIRVKVAKRYKWNEIAREQYKVNPNKFKG